MINRIKIGIIDKADPEDIIKLYKEAGWWKPDYEKDVSFLDGIIKGSFCFAGAFDGKRLIGMGRALSDGCSDAYIQDITVLKKYRGEGLGKKIVTVIINHLESRGIDWIGLVAEPGTENFYEKLGFKTINGSKPMLLSKSRV